MTIITSSSPARRTHRRQGRFVFGAFAARRGARNSQAEGEARRKPLPQAAGEARRPLAQTTGASPSLASQAPHIPQAQHIPEGVPSLQVASSAGTSRIGTSSAGTSSAGTSPAGRSLVSRMRRRVMAGEAGMATAEYAIATLAAVGLAGLLVVLLRSDEVRGFLLNLIRTALSLP